MKCMSEAHEKYGKLPWSDLIDPIVKLVRDGVYVTETTEGYLQSNADRIIGNKAPFTVSGRKLAKGDRFYNEKLVETFEKIRTNKDSGFDSLAVVHLCSNWQNQAQNAFHSEPLASEIVQDINDNGGLYTVDDLLSYKLDESDALEFEFGDFIGYVGAPPSSGVILAFILNIMHNFKERGELPNQRNAEFYHKLAEAYKFAYG